MTEDLIYAVFRHHPLSQSDEAILDTISGEVEPEEWFAKDAELFALLEPTPPRFDCPICFDNVPLEGMFTLDCEETEAHRVCFGCIRETVERALKEGKPPKCPAPGCPHALTQTEIKQICGEDKTVEQFDRMLLRNALATIAGSVSCPSDGCDNVIIIDDMTRKVLVECRGCGRSFCSICRGPYHYGQATCQTVREKEIQWMHWQTQYKSARVALNAEMEAKLATRQREIDLRLRDLAADEEWKKAHCRLCPSCGRLIEHLEGCDSMVCGSDYHGGNTQNGCGASFSWSSAAPYASQDMSHLNSLDIRSEVAKQVGLGEQIDHGEFKCDFCSSNIIGLRFSCLNCPCFNICEQCESSGIEHIPNHIFDIVGLNLVLPTSAPPVPSVAAGRGVAPHPHAGRGVAPHPRGADRAAASVSPFHRGFGPTH